MIETDEGAAALSLVGNREAYRRLRACGLGGRAWVLLWGAARGVVACWSYMRALRTVAVPQRGSPRILDRLVRWAWNVGW